MLINFLDPKLTPSVRSTGLTDDDHPPDNLISSDIRKQQLGFMAYRVQRAPIDLIFELICPVNVVAIKLWTQLGAQKTTSIEIQVKNLTKEFVKCGSRSDILGNGIVFYQEQEESVEELIFPDGFIREKFFRTTRMIFDAKTVKICIKSTERMAVPVLKRIEIWGNVSRTCKPQIQFEIDGLLNPLSEFEPIVSKKRKINDVPTDLSIPDYFLDQITYEIMTLPMVLPSGKIIDQTTLKRHNDIEANWGRQPTDPFTGVGFTGIRKPILDGSLKSQIDQFLTRHSNDERLLKIPRTTGGKIGTNPDDCYQCSNKTMNLYRIINCKHSICRDCLVGLSSQQPKLSKCGCGIEFSNSNVSKIHSVRII